MSASASSANDDDTTGSKNPLLLEAGPSSSVDEIVHKLDMSSGSASIELGPLVVNEDGTLARISNWLAMTDAERQTTTRVLTKRNAARLAKLRQLEAEGKLPGASDRTDEPAHDGQSAGQAEGQQGTKQEHHQEL